MNVVDLLAGSVDQGVLLVAFPRRVSRHPLKMMDDRDIIHDL